ncbi:MAG: hypothetical protein HC894_11985 [Microcoleus sp. SM1_3_4]|nr:hypothetical protein [Microcoleus sp. SM1_3_4]
MVRLLVRFDRCDANNKDKCETAAGVTGDRKCRTFLANPYTASLRALD